MSTAHGGQVLLSAAAAELVRDALPESALLKDLGEHRLKDLARPERVSQLLHPDIPEHFPALRSLDSLPNNLPLQLTSFIGRERELAEVARHLGVARLLTLTGAGGSGKTRLALQAAADALEDHPDGVWLVELAPVGDPAQVPVAVAAALGVRENEGRPLEVTLADALRAKHLLLVLDNCEHLVAACAALAETLLRSCPGLHVLATSREPLGIAGETTWRVPSLSLPVPDDAHSASAEALTQYEAVRLFVDRALAVRPDFRVTNENAPAVAQVCHRLDGIPLAIELAAARLRALPIEQLLVRLEDRFRLLTGGSRTALPRQQTLQALVDWSYSLLAGPEQTLFNRLAVFSGGFTLEAAEAVCAGRGVDEYDVLDLLTHLVDKSLVLLEDRPGGGRYRLLETLRQYARQKLLDAGEADDAHERYAAHFLAECERAAVDLRGARQVECLEQLDAEMDNLRAALRWLIDTGDAERGARLASAIYYYWDIRDRRVEAVDLLERVLALPAAQVETAWRAHAAYAVGLLALGPRKRELMHRRVDEAVDLYERLGERHLRAYPLSLRAAMLHEEDPAAAAALGDEAIQAMRDAGDDWGTAVAALLRAQGWAGKCRTEPERARPLLDEALERFSRLGDEVAAARVRMVQASLRLPGADDYAQRRAALERTLDTMRRLGDRGGTIVLLTHLSESVRAAGDFATAAELCRQCCALAEQFGARDRQSVVLINWAFVTLRLGDAAAAAALFRRAFELAEAATMPVLRTFIIAGFGCLAAARGDFERAVRLIAAAHAAARTLGFSFDLTERLDFEHYLGLARAAMGTAAFDTAWAEGEAMPVAQALADALRDAGEYARA